MLVVFVIWKHLSIQVLIDELLMDVQLEPWKIVLHQFQPQMLILLPFLFLSLFLPHLFR